MRRLPRALRRPARRLGLRAQRPTLRSVRPFPLSSRCDALIDAVSYSSADVLDLEAYGYDSKKEAWAAAEGSRRAHVAKGDKKKKGQNLKDARVPSLEKGDSPATVLRYELLVERAEAKGDGNQDVEIQPLRNSIKGLKDACERAEREEEKEMLDREMKRLRAIVSFSLLGRLESGELISGSQFSDKEKLLDRLRGEYQDITRTFNGLSSHLSGTEAVADHPPTHSPAAVLCSAPDGAHPHILESTL